MTFKTRQTIKLQGWKHAATETGKKMFQGI